MTVSINGEIHYEVNEQGYIDYNDLEEKIFQYRPPLIVAGASAYSREIDFHKIYGIIQSVSSRVTQSNYNKCLYYFSCCTGDTYYHLHFI